VQYGYQRFFRSLNCYYCLMVIIALLCIPAVSMADEASARQLVSEGRTFLGQHDIVNANIRFSSAVSEDPGNQAANAFYSVTRILVLVYGVDFNALLDRNNASSDGRDIYHWDVDFSEDADGNTDLPPGAPTSTKYIDFLTGSLIPEIDGALLNLTQIDSTFSLLIAPEEIDSSDGLEVDYGDVLMYRALLHALKSTIQITASYNLEFNVAYLLPKVEDDSFSMNDDLLAVYADFLKLLTPDQMSSAGSDLELSIDCYLDASDFIRAEKDDQGDDFIAFDSDSLEDEQEFRNVLQDVKASLAGPTMIDDHFVLDLSRFFDQPFGLRTFLPDFDEDNNVIACTFPDPTINGLLPEYTSAKWNDILNIDFTSPPPPVVVGTPPSSNQSAWNYPPAINLVIQSNPANCQPFAIGDLSTGNLNLQVGLPAFSSGVDIYLAIGFADSLFLIDSSNGLQSASRLSILPKWKTNVSAAINESLYGNIPTSFLPPGSYSLYVLVVPTGEIDFSHYYFWATSFNIGG